MWHDKITFTHLIDIGEKGKGKYHWGIKTFVQRSQFFHHAACLC